jgi:hypothetical protein
MTPFCFEPKNNLEREIIWSKMTNYPKHSIESRKTAKYIGLYRFQSILCVGSNMSWITNKVTFEEAKRILK